MQIIRITLAILIVSILVTTGLRAQFAGGAGTSASPYQVNTLAHLNTIAGSSTYWNKYFIQTGNIDASASSSMNSGQGFLPIANTTTAFTGSFNGQGYTISGLYVNRSGTTSVGLFSEVSGATIRGINLVGATISGGNNTGGIVGFSGSGATLQDMSVDATSTINGIDDTGGIVGEAENSSVTNCYTACTVTGDDNVGGLIGFCDNAGTAKTISLCYTTGTVSSTSNDTGGLIGENEQAVEKCYSRATVESTGGNAGVLIGHSYGNVTNCFTIGSVKSSNDAGGLIGYTRSTCTVSKCYAASKVMNLVDDESGGLVADNSGSESDCFWIDLFSDDNVCAPDERSDFNNAFKVVSDVEGATKDFLISAVTGSNAASTMSAFDFSTIWQTAPSGVPGTFPVLRNITVPTDAPAAPTKFTIASGNNKLTLSWASNYETDIASYKLYRSATANFTPASGNLLATIPHTTGGLTYTDDGSGALPAPVNGTVHYYVLVAVDNSGNTSLYHRGAQIPAVNFANVSVSVTTTGGTTYSDIHGSSASDLSAVYTTSAEGNITNTNSSFSDGSGDSQGIGHPSTILGGQLTITPNGMQPTQNWYFYYDDNSVAGDPIRNLTGGAGTGTTLVTGKGNTPVTVTADLDPDFTDYLFYVDPAWPNTAPSINNLSGVTVRLTPAILDSDAALTDSQSSSDNNGAGNYNGFKLEIKRQGGASSDDVFDITAPDANYSVSGGVITYLTKQVATYSYSAGLFTIDFSGTEVIPTQTIVDAIIQKINYYHKAAPSVPAQVVLDWTLNDGLASGTVTQTVTIGYYSGGSGSVSDPWQLATLSDISDMSQNTFHWGDYFILTTNIDASGTANFDDTDDDSDGDLYNDTNDGASGGANDGFSPIGNVTTSFTGNFNGRYYNISGLKISRPSSDYLGLFGMTDGAVIKNTVLTGVDVTGDDEIGGLIGKAVNSTLTDCTVLGDVLGNDDNVGGLIGLSADTDVSGCSFAGDVTGNSNTGGLIGRAQFASLTNKSIKKSWSTGTVTSDGDDVGGLIGEANYAVDSCYSTSTISSTDPGGDSFYGGLIGYITASVSNSHATGSVTASGSTIGGLIGEAQNCNITECYATGNASGVNEIGGLVGFYDNDAATQTCKISDCYAMGNATGTGVDVGGLIGENQLDVTRSYSTGSVTGTSSQGGLIGNNTSGTVTNSFWDTQTSGISTSAAGTGKNTISSKAICTYLDAGWDFKDETDNGVDDIWTINPTDNNGYPALSWQNFTHIDNGVDPVISGDLSICVGESTTLTAAGGASYSWSSGQNVAVVTLSPSTTTTYTVTATAANGCTGSVSASVTVNTLPTPSITDVETSGSANDDGNICAGAGVTVTGSGGGDYLWSEGQTTSSFFIRPYCTTSYELTVTDANGCTATAGTTVFVNYLPVIETVSPSGGSVGTTVTVTGRHLSDVTSVLFNGIAGTNLTVISSTEIRANLPSSGSLSDVLVVSPCGEVSIDIAAPVITSFSPGAGPVGTLITVTGSHLGNLTSVTVGGVQAAVVSNNGSTLVIAVMPGSATGPIALTSGGGSVSTQGQFTVNFTPYPYFQQGGKRNGSNGSANAQQATSLAISTDGSTVVIGAPGDNSNAGAAWIFVKNGTNWEQQGGKLLGTGATSGARMGAAVAVSLDGKTIALGAPGDNSNAGAVFIFTRDGDTWNQEGDKLTGVGAVGAAQQGTSVALSGDGNTVVTGGIADDSYNGAVWAFVRTDGVWAQQGSKMVSTGAIGRARQGASVAVSADGNTLITGGYQDNNRQGAVWIYTLANCEWMQAGAKLVGTGGTVQAWQGYSVALSADGNTAISGASTDNLLAGSAWIFTRSGGSWSQQGSRLVGTHATNSARQGSSVAISADGNTAISGGLSDDSGKGAMWVFTRNGTSWMQQGSKLKGTNATGAAKQGSSVAVNAIGTTALIGGPADNGNRGAFWVYSLGSLPSVQKVVTEDRSAAQTDWSLGQSVPNPSNGRFTVEFTLPEGCTAEWIISDMSGRVVAAQKRNYPAGVNQEIFDLQNGTGVYYYQLKTPFGIKTGKHTIVGN